MKLAITSDSGNTMPLGFAIKEGRLTVDPAMAQRILDEARYEGQRHSFAHHIALLTDAMRREQWTAGSQIAFGEFEGRLHLVNGKHRMHAVIGAGRSIEFQVLIERCADRAALDALYHRFDVVQRRRSLAEVLNATGIAESHKLSKSMAKATYEAAGLLMNDLKRPNYQVDPVQARSVDARLDAALPWWPFAATYERAIEPAHRAVKGKLLAAGVVAVALLTLRYQPAKGWEFWHGLAVDDGLRVADPRQTLAKDLMNRRLNAGSMNQGVIAASLAWNAFYQGRSLKIIKVHQGAKALVLGTPKSTRSQ
jgi:hypothetical protein